MMPTASVFTAKVTPARIDPLHRAQLRIIGGRAVLAHHTVRMVRHHLLVIQKSRISIAPQQSEDNSPVPLTSSNVRELV